MRIHALILLALAVDAEAAFNCRGIETRRALARFFKEAVVLDPTLDPKRLDEATFCQPVGAQEGSFVAAAPLSDRTKDGVVEYRIVAGDYHPDPVFGEYAPGVGVRVTRREFRCASPDAEPESPPVGEPAVGGEENECTADIPRLLALPGTNSGSLGLCDGSGQLRQFVDGNGSRMLHAFCVGVRSTPGGNRLTVFRGYFRCDRSTGRYQSSSANTGGANCKSFFPTAARNLGLRR